MSGRIFGVLFLCMLPALFVAGLWPFDFRPENHVSFLPDTGGVRFEVSSTSLRSDPGGLLFTPSALAYPVGAAGQKGTSIEIRLMASSEFSSCLKRIVEFRDAAGAWAFSLGQWRSFLSHGPSSRIDPKANPNGKSAFGVHWKRVERAL